MTIVEIIAAIVILIIMVVGFTTVYSFAVTTVYNSGHDAKAVADARAEADEWLAAAAMGAPYAGGPRPVSGHTSEATISYRAGDGVPRVPETPADEVIDVVHETVDVTVRLGTDRVFNLYKRTG